MCSEKTQAPPKTPLKTLQNGAKFITRLLYKTILMETKVGEI